MWPFTIRNRVAVRTSAHGSDSPGATELPAAVRLNSSRRGTRLAMIVVSLALGLSAMGCGKGGPATYPVTGRVVFSDGSPLPGGVIEFDLISDQATTSRQPTFNARGVIEADGTFNVATAGNNGAMPGAHRVLVRTLREGYEPGEGESPPELIMDLRFEKYETSGLQVDVKPEKNDFPISVERPGGAGKTRQ